LIAFRIYLQRFVDRQFCFSDISMLTNAFDPKVNILPVDKCQSRIKRCILADNIQVIFEIAESPF